MGTSSSRARGTDLDDAASATVAAGSAADALLRRSPLLTLMIPRAPLVLADDHVNLSAAAVLAAVSNDADVAEVWDKTLRETFREWTWASEDKVL